MFNTSSSLTSSLLLVAQTMNVLGMLIVIFFLGILYKIRTYKRGRYICTSCTLSGVIRHGTLRTWDGDYVILLIISTNF